VVVIDRVLSVITTLTVTTNQTREEYSVQVNVQVEREEKNTTVQNEEKDRTSK
jgi:hypothetical protein